MIVVTEEAKMMVQAVAMAVLPEGQDLRLEVTRADGAESGEKVAMVVEEPLEGDEAVEHRGETLLYVSRRVSAAYDGCVVDLEHTPEGVALSIGPPLADCAVRT